MTEDDIDLRNNSNLNRELGIFVVSRNQTTNDRNYFGQKQATGNTPDIEK